MSYQALLARLVAARRFGVRLELSRMRSLLDRLGQPDRRLGTVIHVAGTNGKGSTVAILAALAGGAGRRVATYTSPHLSTLRERIAIAGNYIDEATLVAAAARVSAAGGDELTFFEQITAMAMVAIADANVDVTVLEVGLGGRLDATNVVDADCAVVTGVALDHQAILGNTVEAIALEKAGIWKPRRCAVIGASGEPAAVPILLSRAREVGARAIVVDDDAVARVPQLSLAGEHQRRNAAAALAAMEALTLSYDPSALATVVVPGRFERCGDLIFDGAHNPHAARALAATLRTIDLRAPQGALRAPAEPGLAMAVRPTLVLAVSADKDAAAMVAELGNDVGAIVATRYQQDRSMSPSDLAAVCRDALGHAHGSPGSPGPSYTIEQADDVVAAVAVARRFGAPILITGSLFVVGEARVAFAGAPRDPIVVSDAHVAGR